MTQWRNDLIKAAAHRASGRRRAGVDADVSRAEHEERNVELGPFFTAGVLLFAYGLLRRRALAVVAGLGAVWLDQRSELGRALKQRVRARSMQRVEDSDDQT
jgi:hypothetical protein